MTGVGAAVFIIQGGNERQESWLKTEQYTVHILCSGLNSEDERQSALLTLYCTLTRRASSRYSGETGTRKKCLCGASAHVHTARAAFFLLEQSLQPTPSPLHERAPCSRLRRHEGRQRRGMDRLRGRIVRTSTSSTSIGPSSTLNAGASSAAAFCRHAAACGRLWPP